MTILEKILVSKKKELEERKKISPFDQLMDRVEKIEPNFLSMDKKDIQIISEIKRASPSKGDIAIDMNIKEKALQYEKGGASAVSVLTDYPFFKGSLEDMEEVVSLIKIPVLRKDFIIDEYQIYESLVYGADSILLIARILDRDTLNSLFEKAVSFGLVPLVEIFSDEDFETIKDIKNSFIGINNRNLSTFDTDLTHCIKMAEKIDKTNFPVALSGVSKVLDVEFLYKRGMKAFLIGEFLSKSERSDFVLRSMLERCNNV